MFENSSSQEKTKEESEIKSETLLWKLPNKFIYL